jgi:hypothetical protein
MRLLLLLLVGCAEQPMELGDMACPTSGTTLTYDNFGRDFMERYCTWCHDSALPRSMRNGAPVFHDFDKLTGVRQVLDHIDEEAGFGPNARNTFMPGERCPSVPGGPLDKACDQPTDEERTNLAIWLACA